MRSTIGVLVVAAVLTGCANPARSSPRASVDGGPGLASTSGDGFTLTLRVERGVARVDEPIEAVATLVNETGAVATLSGPGSGLVFFSVTRLEDGLGSGPPVMEGDCARHELPAGAQSEIAFAKSGGWSADDPNAAFLRAYFADPELRLPAGTWRIEASTSATIGGECTGEPLALRAVVEVVVRGD